jgi:hypothetical protein
MARNRSVAISLSNVKNTDLLGMGGPIQAVQSEA